jgi:uncharacterized protein with NRDE domain
MINERKRLIILHIVELLHYYKYNKVKNNYLRIMHIKVKVENKQLIRVALKIKNKKIVGTLFFYDHYYGTNSQILRMKSSF